MNEKEAGVGPFFLKKVIDFTCNVKKQPVSIFKRW